MRVLLDTDVILDLLLDRAPFADAAAALWLAHEREQLNAYIAAITPINLFYIARKLRDEETARKAIIELLAALNVCAIDQETLHSALLLPFRDYEDAVQHAAANTAGLDAIITRNTKDFSAATLPVFTPSEFIQQYLPTME
ncbi:MAG: PIN domain-containing protein [Candidatus Promineofilum sp.]|nr:PIN domain-containing protein [Promineifilum sp.]